VARESLEQEGGLCARGAAQQIIWHGFGHLYATLALLGDVLAHADSEALGDKGMIAALRGWVPRAMDPVLLCRRGSIVTKAVTKRRERGLYAEPLYSDEPLL